MKYPCQLESVALRCVWGKSSEPKMFCMLPSCALSTLGGRLAYDRLQGKAMAVTWLQHAVLEDGGSR